MNISLIVKDTFSLHKHRPAACSGSERQRRRTPGDTAVENFSRWLEWRRRSQCGGRDHVDEQRLKVERTNLPGLLKLPNGGQSGDG